MFPQKIEQSHPRIEQQIVFLPINRNQAAYRAGRFGAGLRVSRLDGSNAPPVSRQIPGV
jgi:hypothetical protein